MNTIIQDDNGGLWIGTQDGLNRFDGKSFEIFNPDETEGIESPFINTSVITEDRKIWFGSRNGLTLFNPNTEKFQTFTIDKKKILDIQDISIAPTKDLYIATLGYGVVRFDRATTDFTALNWPSGPNKVSLVSCLDNGEILVYTEDQKLFLYNPKTLESFQIPISDLGYDDFTIMRIRKTSKGNVLLGTSHGVFQLDTNNKSIYREFKAIKELQKLSIKDLFFQMANGFLRLP